MTETTRSTILHLAANSAKIQNGILGYFKAPSREKADAVLPSLRALETRTDEGSRKELVQTAILKLEARIDLGVDLVAEILGVIHGIEGWADERWLGSTSSSWKISPPNGISPKREWFDKFAKELDKALDVQRTQGDTLQVLEDLIYANPGLYIEMLKRKVSSHLGYSPPYQSVRNQVDRLVREGRIITIGGPQGKARFCFPHPARISNRKSFEEKQFPIDGMVESEVTDRFTDLTVGTFKSVFLVNSKMDPILLAVPPGVVPSGKVELKAFGQLHATSKSEQIGLRLNAHQGISLPKQIVNAVKVSAVKPDGKEQELWFDQTFWAKNLVKMLAP